MSRLPENYEELPHVVSLGAGVQSSTLALMFSVGELGPLPLAAIFADTGDEPASVYRWLDWIEDHLAFPLYRVGRPEVLSESVLTPKVTADGRLFSKTDIPLFTLSPEGKKGKIRFRSCTRDFKIRPIEKKVRELIKPKRGEKSPRVISCLGISLDEFRRVKPSRTPWIVHRYPLIEQRMSREDCLRWMEDLGFPRPPRSACWHCPFHSDREWVRLRDEEPEEFGKAVRLEKELQGLKALSDNFKTVPFLHASRVPLDEVEFKVDSSGDKGAWQDECEGMCGV